VEQAVKKVIFDTDPGVDDAMALLFLHRHPQVQLLGITTVFGNAGIDITTRNALHLGERFGIAAPVARGAARPLRRPPRGPAAEVHGADGLGNLREAIATARAPHEQSAARFIVETVRRHPGEVTLLAVGPLTNLALALEQDPGIAALVHEVVLMGGAFHVGGQGGNVTPVAEANIHCDPHAADRVFGAGWPVTAVGLDVTHRTLMDPPAFERLREDGGAEGAFLWQISRHYVDFYARHAGVMGCYVHDASAAAYVIEPGLFGTRSGPVRVVEEGVAVGQTIQSAGRRYSQGAAWHGLPEQRVCVEVDAAGVLELLLGTLAPGRGA
jgi:inosine-uridine nucleoside N-ribohydrolase